MGDDESASPVRHEAEWVVMDGAIRKHVQLTRSWRWANAADALRGVAGRIGRDEDVGDVVPVAAPHSDRVGLHLLERCALLLGRQACPRPLLFRTGASPGHGCPRVVGVSVLAHRRRYCGAWTLPPQSVGAVIGAVDRAIREKDATVLNLHSNEHPVTGVDLFIEHPSTSSKCSPGRSGAWSLPGPRPRSSISTR